MSESKKNQILMMRKNADKICRALYARVYNEFSEKNSDTTLTCLDDLFLLCCTHSIVSATSKMFLRKKKHTLRHALALSYAATLYRNGLDLAENLPEYIKQLLPDSFGYRLQKSHKICRQMRYDCAKAFGISTCCAFVFIVGFYLWYVIACFDGKHSNGVSLSPEKAGKHQAVFGLILLMTIVLFLMERYFIYAGIVVKETHLVLVSIVKKIHEAHKKGAKMNVLVH